MENRDYEYQLAKNGGVNERNKFLLSFIKDELRLTDKDTRFSEAFEVAHDVFLTAGSYPSFYVNTKQILEKNAKKENEKEILFVHGNQDLKKTLISGKGYKDLADIKNRTNGGY